MKPHCSVPKTTSHGIAVARVEADQGVLDRAPLTSEEVPCTVRGGVGTWYGSPRDNRILVLPDPDWFVVVVPRIGEDRLCDLLARVL